MSAILKQLDRDVMKREVCEYLLDVNRTHQGPFIPPTAIDWLGDGIVARIGRAVVKADRKTYFDDGDQPSPERFALALEVVEAARHVANANGRNTKWHPAICIERSGRFGEDETIKCVCGLDGMRTALAAFDESSE